MAVVSVTIVPLGTESTSLSQYVADCHKVLLESELNHQLTPMGTIIEGDLTEIMAVISRMHEVPFANGALRVSTEIKIDDRRDFKGSMDQKINAVKNKL